MRGGEVNFKGAAMASKVSVMNRTNNVNTDIMSFSPDRRRKSVLSALDQESVQYANNNHMQF